MKDHKIGGNFVQKYFEGRAKTATVAFPSAISEVSENMTIKVTADNGEVKEFSYNPEKLFTNGYRGFSLEHQVGESVSMDPAEKEERKAARKDQNDKIKKLLAALAAKGKSIDDLLAE